MTGSKHHGGADGALLGGIAGHESGKGHTVRDAILGGGAGHIAEKHHEKNLGSHHGTSTTGNASGHNANIGDKISGKIEVAVGKMTGSQHKVLEGEIKQSHGSAGLNHLKDHGKNGRGL